MHATGREKPGPYGLSKVGQQFMAGMMALSRELADLHRAVHQLVQALRLAVVGAGQRRLGPRQPDDRLPARRPRPGAPRREPLPGRRHERLPDLRRDGRRRPVRHRARAQARADEFKGNGYLATGHAAHAARPVRGDPASWSGRRRRVEIFGEDVVDHYLNAARVEQETYDSIVHPGTASATSSAADRVRRPRRATIRHERAAPGGCAPDRPEVTTVHARPHTA